MGRPWNVHPFTESAALTWDALVADSNVGSMLHTRRFLDRQGLSELDCSLMVVSGRSLEAVIPLQQSLGHTRSVVSHPGATFGGVIHSRRLSGPNLQVVLDLVAHELAGLGFSQLEYRAVPLHLHIRACQEELFRLQKMGASTIRTQVNSVVDLERPGPMSERKQRNLRKASSLSLEVLSASSISEFHQTLDASLRSRHSVGPTHTADDLGLICRLFPEHVSLLGARKQGTLVAGAVIFSYPTCDHAQYIFSTDEGRTHGASDLVLQGAMSYAASKGKRYFSLGTSNDPSTGALNEGLFQSKQEFGAGSVLHTTYSLPL
jgi:hypothetical protein